MKLWLILPAALATMMLDESSTVEVSSTGSKTVEGTVEYNGDSYKATCDCTDESSQEVETIKCHPTKVNLTQDREGTGASYDEISTKISGTDYTYVRVTKSSFHSIDGRSSDKILGTPGGDAGEFILALLVYEDISGRQLTEDAVETYFKEWLNCMDASTFYMCTDDNAVAHLEKQLSISGLDIQNPRSEYKDSLLTALEQSENEGDVHIHLMLKSPDLYAIRAQTIKYFLRVFYSTLWNDSDYKDMLTLDVLPGSHNEKAFLEIRTEDTCNLEQVSPLVSPRDGDSESLSVYVNHIDAASIRRAQLSEFFANKIARQADDITAETMFKRMNHHGLYFLDVTGSYVAKDLPFYTATFV
mmetsp:Transcript_9372/g.18006  ORF Transcript_9372/g.18006 Transcript_9372/m.18006 type:complete len:358 (-) Transcript_9372:904-1977(-)